jgi:hypothetical protein
MTQQPPDIQVLTTLRDQAAVALQAEQQDHDDPYRERRGSMSGVDAAHRRRQRAEQALIAAQTARKRDLRIIHVAKRQLAIDDAAYRLLIRLVSGGQLAADGVTVHGGRTDTAGALSAAEREDLLQRLADRGFRRAHKGRPSAAQMDRQSMLTRVEQLLADQRLPWAYAGAILRRQRGITDTAVAAPITTATDIELRGVIAALDRRAKRQAAQARGQR